MKKKIIVIMLLLVCFLSGCYDIKPTSWGINNKDSRWEVWGKGTLFLKEKINHPTDGDKKIFKFIIDGESYVLGGIKDPGTIKVSQTGILYKNNFGKPDHYSWFQWVITEEGSNKLTEQPQEDNTAITQKIKDINEAEIKLKQEKNKINALSKELQNSWKRAEIYKPSIYKVVLVRLDNEIITTAYFTNKKEWKLEFFKNKMNGGIPLRNVIDWKELD